MPVPVFCCFCISEKLYRKYSRNCTGQSPSTLFLCNEDEARRGAIGSQPGGQTRPRRGQTWARAWPMSRPTRAPSTLPLRPYILRLGKTLNHPSRNPRKVPTPPSTQTLVREGSEALPGTLPEGEIIAGGLYTAMPASATMRE